MTEQFLMFSDKALRNLLKSRYFSEDAQDTQ